MSNMSITIRNQINAGSGKRAHPEHLKALAATKKEGQGRVRVEPTNEALRHVLRHPNGMAFRAAGHGRVAVGSLHPAPAARWFDQGVEQADVRDGSIRVVEQADTRKRAAAEKPKEERKRKRGGEGTSARQQRRAMTSAPA